MSHPTAASGKPAQFRFSTSDWPEPQRRAAAIDIYGRGIMRYELDPEKDAPLQIEASFLNLPGLGVASVASSAASAHRERRHLTGDELVLNINLSGTRSLRQCGREAIVGAGGAVLTSGAETAAATISASRFATFRLPARALAALVPQVHDRIAEAIPADAPALRLLMSYAAVLREDAMAAPELQSVAVTHVYDLVALALGAGRDATETARLRGVRAARLRAVKADIAAHLAGSLSVVDVAARQALPVRYVQRLFETEGTTFTAFVLEQRLARAHRLLSDVRLAGRPISAIALDAGFTALSYFNHSFRRRFGIAPSDLRERARRSR